MAGYSGTPLVKKLGIKPGFNVAFAGAPPGYANELDLPPNVSINSRPGKPLDFAQLFVKSEKELKTKFLEYANRLNGSGMLWVSWPKKTSKIVTDITETTIRNYAIQIGLVDIKVCAVDEIWSGLKLVIPVKNRVIVK